MTDTELNDLLDQARSHLLSASYALRNSVVQKIIASKRLTVIDLSEILGVSRQAIYDMLGDYRPNFTEVKKEGGETK